MALTHNTVEKIAPSDARTLRQLILAVLSILLILNVLCVLFIQGNSFNGGYWLLHNKWRRILLGPAVDWLILGDSSGNQGLQAGTFAKEFGPTYNYCNFMNALIVNDWQMLDEYVARHGPPKGVLLVHTYDVWEFSVVPKVVAEVPVATKRFAEYSPFIHGRFAFLRDFALDRWLPIYSQPRSYRGALLWPPRAFAPRVVLDNWGYGQVAKGDSAEVMAHLQRTSLTARNRKREVTVENRWAMERICRLADQRGFDVYFAMSPIYEGAIADTAIWAEYSMVLDYLASLEGQYSRFHVLGPFPFTVPINWLEGSLDHPSQAAAEQFTKTMIDRLKAQREGTSVAGDNSGR